MQLVQITCEAPPAHGGVAQYVGGLIGREQSAGLRTSCVFEVGEMGRATEGTVKRVPMANLAVQVKNHIRDLSGNGSILLHYSGYGYHRSGAPMQLIEELRKIRTASRWRLTTLFHELHASGYPWQRSFWQCPAQLYAARQLARLSDVSVCTSGRSRARLRLISGLDDSRIRQISIPATVGESDRELDWATRQDVCIVFGRRERKETLLADHWDEIQRFLRRLGVRELRDLGTPVRLASLQTQKGAIPFRHLADSTNAAIAHEFASAKFFLVETPVDLLDKSTVFANGVAQGCIPLWVKSPRASASGIPPILIDGAMLERAECMDRLPSISVACREYYRKNRSWAVHWNVLADSLVVQETASYVPECAS